MLSVHGISKSFNFAPILNQISFSILPGERVGLIGPNGSGKSTLLRILAGLEQSDSGSISKTPPSLTLSYLPQGFDFDPEMILGDLIYQQAGDPIELDLELANIAALLAEHPESTNLQVAFDNILNRMNRSDLGHIQSILGHLELSGLDPTLPLYRLSGGQKTRLALAVILLNEPDILLLDEPTNHLDIGMLEWLEEWLTGFPGAALIVSHDRTFIDRTVTRILELDPLTQNLFEYPGNFSQYVTQKQHRLRQQWSAWKDQEFEIRRMKQDIARTKEQARHVEITTKPNQPTVRRYAKKVARKAAAREKKLDRYLAADDRVEKPSRSWEMKLDFSKVEQVHISRDVVALENLSVGYPDSEPLLTDLNLRIRAGQRVVLTGPNGTGKTTLLRTIAGHLVPLSGSVRLGPSVKLGYMSQEQELLDPASTALATIRGSGAMTDTEARSFLHYFLFEGDDSLRLIGSLSFGERSRLALAKLVTEGCTFLLLDEPINHLDIPSRSRFEAVLASFPGTILAVVHDRYFIDRFATDVWWVKDRIIEQTIRRLPE